MAAADCPKVFIPNSGGDKECPSCTIVGQVECLLQALQADAADVGVSRLLTHVLVDIRQGCYGERDELARLRELGIEIIDAAIVMPDEPQRHDPQAVSEQLLRLRDENRQEPAVHA